MNHTCSYTELFRGEDVEITVDYEHHTSREYYELFINSVTTQDGEVIDGSELTDEEYDRITESLEIM